MPAAEYLQALKVLYIEDNIFGPISLLNKHVRRCVAAVLHLGKPGARRSVTWMVTWSSYHHRAHAGLVRKKLGAGRGEVAELDKAQGRGGERRPDRVRPKLRWKTTNFVFQFSSLIFEKCKISYMSLRLWSVKNW